MTVLSVLLLVFFIIVAILLILLVLVQSEEGDSLGGIFAGGSGSAFGSRSGNILTRTTTILGALFLVLSLGLALINRTPGGSGVERAARELAPSGDSQWWREEAPVLDEEDVGFELPLEAAPPADSPAATESPADTAVPAADLTGTENAPAGAEAPAAAGQ